MKVSKKIQKTFSPKRINLIENRKEENWQQIKTLINILREPILILDKSKKVITSNDSFYSTFQLDPKETEGKLIYDLGHGQWNISGLRKLLEEILPQNHFFKDFEITHTFPFIGRKVLILNARELNDIKFFRTSFIIVAIEDITDMMVVAESLADHAKSVNYKFNQETQKLESYIGRLEKEVNVLKQRL